MNIQNSIDALFAEKRLIRPDYDNCITDLPNLIFRKYGLDTVGNTLPLIDKHLEKDHKNVVLLFLDGMGIKIMERHLADEMLIPLIVFSNDRVVE